MSQEVQEFCLKIILAGDSGVGKTNILAKFTRDYFSEDTKPTIGVEFATKNIIVNKNKLVKASIWDTAGQEQYSAITKNYFRGALGALIVFDITQSITFDSVDKWLNEVRSNAEKDVIIMLVGNKLDLKDTRTVSEEEAINFSKTNKLLYIETSALDSTNIVKAFETLVTEIVNRLGKLKTFQPSQSQKSLPLEEDPLTRKQGIKIQPQSQEEKDAKKNDCC